jgi:hypothetical protein
VANSIKRIRTLALVGQAGSGKTSLTEALLAKAGAIPTAGSVERGTTVADYTPLEKQLQHSLKLAVASFDCQQTRIHLLDTPGYPDFLGQSLPALAAVETAAIVINAQNGIEMMTGRFLQWAARRGLDRLIVVCVSGTLIAYSLYTISPQTIALHGSADLVYTVPIVTYALFRYLYLLGGGRAAEDPSGLFAGDRHLQVTALAWLGVVIWILR